MVPCAQRHKHASFARSLALIATAACSEKPAVSTTDPANRLSIRPDSIQNASGPLLHGWSIWFSGSRATQRYIHRQNTAQSGCHNSRSAFHTCCSCSSGHLPCQPYSHLYNIRIRSLSHQMGNFLTCVHDGYRTLDNRDGFRPHRYSENGLCISCLPRFRHCPHPNSSPFRTYDCSIPYTG